MDDFNKNDKQLFFNQVKGTLIEMNKCENFCNVTIEVGTEKKRFVNIVVKKDVFLELEKKHQVDTKVCAKFYVVSRKSKEGKWYTLLNFIDLEKLN